MCMDKVRARQGDQWRRYRLGGRARPPRSSYDFGMHSVHSDRVVDALFVTNSFVNFTTRVHVLVHLNVDTLKSM
jgi:hypothetical protein